MGQQGQGQITTGIDGTFHFTPNGKPKMEVNRLNIYIPGTTTFQGQPQNIKLLLPWNADSTEHPAYPLARRLWDSEEDPGSLYDIRGTYRSSTWSSGMTRREILARNVVHSRSSVPAIPAGVEIDLPYAERQKAYQQSPQGGLAPSTPAQTTLDSVREGLRARRLSVPLLKARSEYDGFGLADNDASRRLHSRVATTTARALPESPSRMSKAQAKAHSADILLDEFSPGPEQEDAVDVPDNRCSKRSDSDLPTCLPRDTIDAYRMAALRSSGTGMPSSSTSGLRVGTTSSGINATAIQGTFSSRPRGQSYPVVIDDEEDATTRCHPLESRAVAIGKRPFEEMADETAKLKDDNDSELEEFDQELLLLGQKHLAEIRARKAGQDDASTRTTSIGPSGDSASEIKARRLDGHVEHDTRQTFKSNLPSGNNVENGVEVESSPAPLNLVTKKSIKAMTAGSRVPFGVITDDELNRLAGKRPVGRPSNKDAASRKALLKKIMGSGQSLYVDKSADAPDNSSTKRVTRSTSSDSSMTVPPAESSSKNPVSLSLDATNSADGKPTLQKTRTASSK